MRGKEDNQSWPSPEEVAMKAEALPVVPSVRFASDYVETIDVLKGKGFTWGEIGQWFREQGITISDSAINSAWQKHRAKRETR